MAKKTPVRYTITLPPNVEERLNQISEQLEISKAEAFRRALTLLGHAAEAEKVTLTAKDGTEQRVLVR